MRRNKPGFWSIHCPPFCGPLICSLFFVFLNSYFVFCISILQSDSDQLSLPPTTQFGWWEGEKVYRQRRTVSCQLYTPIHSAARSFCWQYFSLQTKCISLKCPVVFVSRQWYCFPISTSDRHKVTCAFADSCYQWYLILLGIIVIQVISYPRLL